MLKQNYRRSDWRAWVLVALECLGRWLDWFLAIGFALLASVGCGWLLAFFLIIHTETPTP